MTFSTLQTLSNSVTPTDMPLEGMPGDDVSVSKAIAERYQKAGIDPAMAYDDPETALREFDLEQFGF